MVSKTFHIKRIMKWRKYIFKGSIVAKKHAKRNLTRKKIRYARVFFSDFIGDL